MLLLLFETGDGRYALDSRDVVEVVPLVKVKKIPAAPAFVQGMMNYHGLPVPVFDFCAIEGGEPSRKAYSTRIILVRYPLDGEEKLVGVIAEHVTDVIRCSEEDIRSSGILLERHSPGVEGSPGQDEIVQFFDVRKIIPEDVLRELY
ncbi:MAG: chemotaxis protein CheW [Desulfobulbaceae bacterium]